ncbi:MAG: hypothetical protein QXO09_06185 [Candidatus Caldarchaeum sp.]
MRPVRYLTYPEIRNHTIAPVALERIKAYFRHRGWSDDGYSLEGYFIRFNDKAGRHINWNRLFWFFAHGQWDNIDDLINAEVNEMKTLERFTDADLDRYILQFWGEEPFLRELPDGTVVDTRGGQR